MDFRQVTLGEYLVLLAALLSVVSLFLPWFDSIIPRAHGESAFAYSEVAAVIVIVFFLATLFLALYPVIAPEFGLPPLPFASAPLYLILGSILLLVFTYELGKYDCVATCQGASRGFGLWLAFISACLYLFGAVINWGSRPARQRLA